MNDTITLFDAHSSTLTHILFDEGSREAAIVDPVDTQIERDLAVLADRQLQLKWVLETHAHADHVTAAGKLAARTGASTAVPAYCGIQQATRQLEDGDTLSLGNRAIRAIHTPGHTAGSMCFRWGNAVLTGDTLLIGGCGRTDFQSGNAGALYDSITQKLFTLPDTTRVLPGHDYHGNTESTIGAEKQSNPRLAGKTREEFINLMNDLHLAPPKMIEVAVPANLHLGALPDDVIQPMPDYAGNVSLSTAHRWWREGRVVMV
ncbi:MAG: MBL fold metallo-hydrolase, partial [Betaproteobacteria bacterium]|nr:MBL fold metallo-hydrolase [Betaproteobacteria bacterium]